MPFGREMRVGRDEAQAGECVWAYGVWGRFSRLREQRRKSATNAIGGKPVRARQEPDALRFEREIRVFPALAHTLTKNYERHNL